MSLPEPRCQPFSIQKAGKRWTGDWCLDDGELQVRSAYGSRTVRAGRAKPENVAAKVLGELVEEWRRARRA